MVQTVTESLTTTTLDSYYNSTDVCSDRYRTRSESERNCKGGWQCTFGVCVVHEDNSVECECDHGAIGTHCTQKCCRDCSGNGDCFLDLNDTEWCNCHYNYTGSNCETLKPPATTPAPKEIVKKEVDTRTIVGVVVGVVIMSLVVIATLLYCMWKRRVLLVMKLVHYIKPIEDDDREWDAFVSYKSVHKDESFVVHVLYPKLEQELGFKLNLHFRDFVPGETIQNNIIKAVQCSRRTILVITPSFVQSEFTRLEYQVAQQEMLKRKHRIIPVLLEDITECEPTMDPNLKVILKSVSYIEWPKDVNNETKVEKFWKRMQLSLPKKRPGKNAGQPEMATVADDIQIAVDPMAAEFTNIYARPNYAFEDENADEPYDTINEDELERQTTLFKNIAVERLDSETGEQRPDYVP